MRLPATFVLTSHPLTHAPRGLHLWRHTACAPGRTNSSYRLSPLWRLRASAGGATADATPSTPSDDLAGVPPPPPPPPSQQASAAHQVLGVLTNGFPVWVLASAIAGVLHPPSFLWYRPTFITPTLAFVMLGMGLTIPSESFSTIARTPRNVIIGVLAQYTLMPTLAKLLTLALRLPPPLAAGLILVGVCPGGAASNLVCLLARADVALSVVLTLSSTLLSVMCVPALMGMLASTLVPVPVLPLFISTASVVLLPLAFGAFLRRQFPALVDRVSALLPLVSVAGVTCVCGSIVAANATALLTVGPALLLSVALLHVLGGVAGFTVARLNGLSRGATRTVCVEVMMQNSSLAVSLANAHFAHPLTPVPGAISATVHSVLGSILAGYWRFQGTKEKSKE